MARRALHTAAEWVRALAGVLDGLATVLEWCAHAMPLPDDDDEPSGG